MTRGRTAAILGCLGIFGPIVAFIGGFQLESTAIILSAPVVGVVLGVAAIVLGVIGRKDSGAESGRTGIVLGILSVMIGLLVGALIYGLALAAQVAA